MAEQVSTDDGHVNFSSLDSLGPLPGRAFDRVGAAALLDDDDPLLGFVIRRVIQLAIRVMCSSKTSARWHIQFRVNVRSSARDHRRCAEVDKCHAEEAEKQKHGNGSKNCQ